MKRIIAIFAVAVCTAMTSLHPAAMAVEAYASVSVSVSVSETPQTRSAKASKPSKTQTVTFCTKLHCMNCVKKVNENISFEKGVKDLKVSLEDQTITVTFDPSKTSVEALSKAISKLGYKAEVKK